MSNTLPETLEEIKTLIKDPILIVDDDPLTLKSLHLTLEREGYKILACENGKQALEALKNQPVSVIICDYKLPDLTGLEILKIAADLQPDSVRCLLTGLSDQNLAVQAVNEANISLFIQKPWDIQSFVQSIQTLFEKYYLIKRHREFGKLLEEQHQILKETYQNLQTQLEMGGRVHNSLLKATHDHRVAGFDIAATTVSSQYVDGDFYEFYHPLPHILDVLIGDVMGKGIPAALVATVVKTQFNRYAVPRGDSKLIFEKREFWRTDFMSPLQIVSCVHDEITNRLIDLEYFVSLIYGRFNLLSRTFTYIDCGFTRMLYFDAQKKELKFMRGSNFPLGMVAEENFQMNEVHYSAGDFFVFYSDGVTEALSPDKSMFGEERLYKLVEKMLDKSSEEINTAIKDEIRHFTQRESLDDDLTLIIIKVNECAIFQNANAGPAKFNSVITQLSAVRELIHEVCLHTPGDKQTMSHQMQLALDEVFCNIVLHSYQNKPGGVIYIHTDLGQEGLSVEISDQGVIFDPSSVPLPSLFGDKEHGYGWYLIRHIADEVSYTPKISQDGWNCLKIYKRYVISEEIMDINSEKKNGILILTPRGSDSLDARQVPEFKEKVLGLIQTQDAKQVIINLSHLNFMDSSGLGCMLSILRQMNTRGGVLKLAQMNQPVRGIFELVSMHKIFEIYPTNEEAVRALQHAKV